ncbi:hypothetical protein [Deinococcus multiflagellatus]|uniref:Uncharacterized protein n=1 Tax=Deinococcus multiflagellatus TaxID=1656887 RepID=A0ABW1ZK94_9DEIO
MRLSPADLFTLLREAFLAFGQDKAPGWRRPSPTTPCSAWRRCCSSP